MSSVNTLPKVIPPPAPDVDQLGAGGNPTVAPAAPPAKVQTAAPTPAPPGGLINATERGIGSFESASGLPPGMPAEYVENLKEGAAQIAKHPIDSAKLVGGSMVDAQTDQARQGNEAFHRGDFAQALAHYTYSGIPVAGPILAKVSEQIAAQDYAGAAGTLFAVIGPAAAEHAIPHISFEAIGGTEVKPPPENAISKKMADVYGDTGKHVGQSKANRMQAGVDFPGNFQKDNYDSRRTTGNNMFDPDSLMTGEESQQGMTHTNSRRTWPSQEAYLDAVHGNTPIADVIKNAPRELIPEGAQQLEEGAAQEGNPSFARSEVANNLQQRYANYPASDRDKIALAGETHGSELLPNPEDQVGTEHTIHHEFGHIDTADVNGLPVGRSFISSHLHPDSVENGALGSAYFDWGQIKGATDFGNGKVHIPTETLKNLFPGYLRTYMAGGVVEELLGGTKFNENTGLYGDHAAARKLGNALGYSPKQTNTLMREAELNVREHYRQNPQSLDIIKNAAATREDGLSQALHTSQEKVADTVNKLRSARNGKTQNAGNIEGTGATDAGVIPEAQPAGAGGGAEGGIREDNGSNIPGRVDSQKGIDAQKILDLHQANGGSTFNVATGTDLDKTDNYAVSTHPDRTQNVPGELTAKHIQDYVAKNKDLLADPTESLGTWKRPDGSHDLDISKTIPDRAEAVRLGHEHGQDAIRDLKNGNDIFMKDEPQGGVATKLDQQASPKMADLVSRTPWVEDQDTGYQKLDVVENGEPVGELHYSGDPGDENSRIRKSYIEPEYRNQGIAKEMYKSAIEDAKARGVRVFKSDTTVSGDAQHVWDSLMRDGQYPIKKVYTNHFNANGGGGVEYHVDLTPNADIANKLDQSRSNGEPESERAATLRNRISSRFPSAVSATEDPMGHDLTLSGDMILKHPAVAQRLADKIVAQNKSMAFTPEELKTPKGTFDSFTQHAKDNIKAVYERVSPENRIQDREWYDGAHEIGNQDAKVSGLEPRQHWAAIATQSPQKDWNQNVSLYERILDIVQNKSDVTFTPEMQAKAKDFIQDIAASNKKRAAEGKRPISPWVDNYLIKRLKGKPLAEITNPVEKAAFVRIYDEAHNPREFREIKPDGTKGDIVKLAGTDTPEKVAWGGLNSIAKGISVLQDGSLENISRNLGEAHKVRSFYNNIAEPNAEQGDVTVDTHHVGIGLMRPVVGNDPETGLNFGGNGSTISGVHGTYPLYADATRQAMHEINAEHPNDPPLEHPRQLQSVVWVEWRKLFPPEARTAKTKLDVDNIWKEHLDGKITADEARQQVFKYADELRSRLDAGKQGPVNEGELSAHQLSGSGSPSGRGGKSASRVDEQLDAGAKAAAAAEAARVAKNKADLADYVARSAAKKKISPISASSALGKK